MECEPDFLGKKGDNRLGLESKLENSLNIRELSFELMIFGTNLCQQIKEDSTIVPLFQEQYKIAKQWIEDDKIIPPPQEDIEKYEKLDTQLKQAQIEIEEFKKKIKATQNKIKEIKEEKSLALDSLLKYVPKYPEIKRRIPLLQNSHLNDSNGIYSTTKRLKNDFSSIKSLDTNLESRNQISSAIDRSGKQVVIKQTNIQDSENRRKFLDHTVKLCKLQHPSIISFISVFIDSSVYPTLGCIVTPFYPNGTLLDWSSKNRSTEKLIQVFFKILFFFLSFRFSIEQKEDLFHKQFTNKFTNNSHYSLFFERFSDMS